MRELSRAGRIDVGQGGLGDPTAVIVVEGCCSKAVADLTPHLSLSPNTRGYSLAARTPGATTEERWSDKDQLLNRMNYHHFHLGKSIEAAGHAARTDDLLFAEVSRDAFKVVAIFSHEVFDTNSEERRRLTKLPSAGRNYQRSTDKICPNF